MEYREGGHGDVGELELDVFAGARVRQGLQHWLQLSYEVAAQRIHPPAYNRKRSKVQVSDIIEQN